MLAFLAAVLVFVAASVATALAALLPGGGRGLDPSLAMLALGAGVVASAGAFLHVRRLPANRPGGVYTGFGSGWGRISPWAWAVFAVFAMFALRTFCWLVYFKDTKMVVGSPNNLGDISLHLQYARDFANGASWWPDHPQASGQPLRYYPGMDLFESLLLALGADDLRALVWVGLGGSLLTLMALYRWGGTFTVAGFLFSGGLAGFRFFHEGKLADYQDAVAWKSVPLSMFVTQRPFLFALPAGLLLLAHWKKKFFTEPPRASAAWSERGLLPFWVELLLYAMMPVFHLFAFVFLSALLGCWFVVFFRRAALRSHLANLVGAALLPASGLVWLMTGHFSAGDLVRIKWGWMQGSHSFLGFWLLNFGLFALLAPALWISCAADAVRAVAARWNASASPGDSDGRRAAGVSVLDAGEEAAVAFVLPAGVLFVVACVVMLAPWDWDNTKLMLWCYLAMLPFLWQRWVRPLAVQLRWPLCAALFFSGAVSLAGGLGTKHLGYSLIERSELDAVGVTVRGLPPEARYAAAPDYNHPLVYFGRKVAVGYDGHLFSQGIDYAPLTRDLNTLMLGQPGWEEAAARLGVRYVFWGPREEKKYAGSLHPWMEPGPPAATGEWGTVYAVGGVPQSR